MAIVNNVKGGFKVCECLIKIRDLPNCSKFTVKHYSNFSVIRITGAKSKVVYTAWWTGNHVNVTGVQSVSEFDEAVENFLEITGSKLQFQTKKIHNICASGQVRLTENLNSLRRKIDAGRRFKSFLDLSFSPALRVKRITNSSPESGVCLIFSSGKLCFFGFREERVLFEVYESLCASIQEP